MNSSTKSLSWLLIGIGIILRLAQYLSNKSLWRDELFLALNLSERSIPDLFKPLDYNQYAPAGFLIIQKIVISLFGTSELAFRFFPLICGIGSLFLFYKLSLKCLSKGAVPIALGFFVVLVPLIYYSSETKQYSSDVLIALLLILLALKITSNDLNIFKAFIYGIFGATSVWFSHTAVFVLAGITLYIILNSILTKDWKKVFNSLVFCLLWIISFFASYLITLIHTDVNKGLKDLWSSFYLSLPSNTWKNIYMEFLRFSTFNTPAIICLVVGAIILYKKNKNILFIITVPVFITFFASLLHKYPLFERFILFLIPFLILLIAEGIEWIRKKVSNISPILSVLVICLLFYKPLYFTKENFTNPLTQEEMKPVLQYVKEHLKANDVIYISNPLQHAFKYYAPQYNICNNFLISTERKNLEEANCNLFNYRVFLGVDKINNPVEEFEKLNGNKRVWLLLPEKRTLDLQNNLSTVNYLDKIGVKIGSFIRPGVILYLYNVGLKRKDRQIFFPS